MRLLLFFISLLFSFIFYAFYFLWKGLNIFWNKVFNSTQIDSFSWNLLIESFIFFIIWIIFVFYFTPQNSEKKIKLKKEKLLYIWFYIIFFSIIYILKIPYDNYIFIIIVIFLFWDMCFNLISWLSIFKKQKNNLKYFWLILNYLSIFLWLYYLYISWFSLYIFCMLFFSIIFNLYIHKNYTNYISLLFSIFVSIILIYFLFLELYNLYIILFEIFL